MSARLHDLTMPSSRTQDSPPGGSARRRRVLAAALIPLQLFLAAGWLRAGMEKVIDPTWWNADALRGFLLEQRPDMLPWFTWFSDVLVEPLALGGWCFSWRLVLAFAAGFCENLGHAD